MKAFLMIVGLSLALLNPGILVLAESESNEHILDEIMDVMRQFGLGNKDVATEAEETDPPPTDAVNVMESQQQRCPIISNSTSMTATCSEVKYKCNNDSHILVFNNGKGGSGLCLIDGESSRKCDSTNGYDPAVEPYCSPVCEVEEIEFGKWQLHQPGGVLINRTQVLPGSTISYSCESKYTLIGSSGPFTCQENGKFSGSIPTCKGKVYTNLTECGGGNWTRIYHFDISKDKSCPSNWQLIEHEGEKGCDSKVTGACSPIYIEVGDMDFDEVCGMALGRQIAFPDAFSVGTGAVINSLYVDGLSITYGFPREHVWTYAVGASKNPLFGGSGGNCPCDDGQPQPHFVGENMYCDSGHQSSNTAQIEAYDDNYSLYTDIHNHTLWKAPCGKGIMNTCCGESGITEDVKPPWFHRSGFKKLSEKTGLNMAKFEAALCTHEVDMQEGALITAFELYIK